jgi:hypothetical protein
MRLSNHLPIALACLVLGGRAGQLQAAPVPTNLDGVSAFVEVPAGFDPVAARAADLQAFGFPPRPNKANSPGAYAGWLRAVTASRTRLVPVLERTTVTHGPVSRASVTANNASANWDGAVLFDANLPYQPASFAMAQAFITVPSVRQAAGACRSAWSYSSAWPGIGGVLEGDIVQAGVEADAFCSNGVTSTFYNMWVEFFPAYEQRISNFPVNPGDTVFSEVWTVYGNPYVAYAYLADVSTGQAAALAFWAPAGTLFRGTSAEFVVERPQVNGVLSTLADYGELLIFGEYGESFGGQWNSPGGPGPGIGSIGYTMYDGNGAPISVSTALGLQTTLHQAENSAVNGGLP